MGKIIYNRGIKIIPLLCAGVLLIFSCAKRDHSNPVDPNYDGIQYDVDGGFIEKGPFTSGSSVTIQELNDAFTPITNVHNTTVEDNTGLYTLSNPSNTRYIEVAATGSYYDETRGITTGPLTLKALADISDSSLVNVNVLTTIIEKRILYLRTEEYMSFEEAREQAEEEVLDLFGIYNADLPPFHQMSITQNNAGGALLLAASAIIQGKQSASDVSQLLGDLNYDLEEDGDLDDANLYSDIYNNARDISLLDVEDNLRSYYSSLGINVTIPDFAAYVENVYWDDPPDCEFSNLVDGGDLQVGEINVIEVNATDSDGEVRVVSFYIDNSLMATDNSSPFEYSWDTSSKSDGWYDIKAVAMDDDGKTDSHEVSIHLTDIVGPLGTWEGEYEGYDPETGENLEFRRRLYVEQTKTYGDTLWGRPQGSSEDYIIFELEYGTWILNTDGSDTVIEWTPDHSEQLELGEWESGARETYSQGTHEDLVDLNGTHEN